MVLITETGQPSDLAALDRAWSGSETFTLVSRKQAATADWLLSRLELLPEELRSGHFVLLTSGSTGRPKLVVGDRHRSERLAAVIHEFQENQPVQESIVVLPLHYTYAFINQWLWSRCFGRRLVRTSGFGRPDELREALRRSHEAMICMVGTQVQLLSDHFQSEAFPGIIRVNFVGGRFPQEQLGNVRKMFPCAKIFNNFGCAEAMPRLTISDSEDSSDGRNVGRALPGIDLRISELGEVTFVSPYGAVGLIDDGGFTRVDSATYLKTGDHGQLTEDGTLFISGRSGEVFKRHGEKISLPILLCALLEVWKGQAAFYRERDRHGEDGHVLILCPNPNEEQLRHILNGFRTRHPRAWWPLRIEGASGLPFLPSGKIDLQAIPALQNKTVHWNQRI